MPSHCENDLWLSGPDTDIAAVLAHIGADQTPPQFDFNALIPYPEPFKSMDEEAEAFGSRAWPHRNDPGREAKLVELKQIEDAYKAKWGTTSDGYNSGGYEWCIANWGTKWGAYNVVRRDYDGRVCVTYQTAWAPSRSIIVALAKMFPTVTFALEYFERGMGYAGGFRCPSEDYYYGEDAKWEAGMVIDEWETREYHGCRGG